MLASALGPVLAAVIALLFFLRTSLHYRFIRHRLLPVVGKRNSLLLVVAPLFPLLCLWAVYCIGGDWSMARGLTTASRFGCLVSSSAAIAMAGVFIGTWPAQMRALFFDVPAAST